MNFHQKFIVYEILDYFGILFILNIHSVLREFILSYCGIRNLQKDCFVENSGGLRYF